MAKSPRSNPPPFPDKPHITAHRNSCCPDGYVTKPSKPKSEKEALTMSSPVENKLYEDEINKLKKEVADLQRINGDLTEQLAATKGAFEQCQERIVMLETTREAGIM